MAFDSKSAKLWGKVGGLKTKQKLKDDPNYFSRVGLIGGMKILNERGKEYYSTIGKRGGKKTTKEQS